MSTFLAILGSTGLVDMILGVIGTLLYPLFSIIFLLIDGIQNIFYSFAGIGDAWHQGTPITAGNSGGENDTGILYHLMTEPLVKNMIFSIMILALFLIIIFTVMAFIKNAYSAKPKNWKEIIANSIKGLANFILLPVCCLLGVWMGNILLNAINGATSNVGSNTMARKLFIASAYNANIFRNWEESDNSSEEAYNKVMYFANYWGLADELQIESGQSLDYYADVVDKMYSYDRVFLGSQIEVGHFYNLYQINYLVLISCLMIS